MAVNDSLLFCLDLRTSFDDIGRISSDRYEHCGGVPADLVYEYECVDDAEAFDAEYTELRVDDARFRRSSNTCGRRLQEFTDELVRRQKLGEGRGMEGKGRRGIRRQGRTGWNAALQWR